jgi:2,5-diamino-6-(ribosylamino)-4(3H)-pyrimidinone 5'-phosphate reductase
MLPYIIINNEMSVDGRFDWMLDDQGLYYRTISRWKVDAMLSGSQTMLDAAWDLSQNTGNEAFTPAAKDFDHPLQLLVVIDSHGQIRNWPIVRNQPYWRDVVVLCSKATPGEYLEHLREQRIEFIVAGEEQVDLHAALTELYAEYRVESIRVDSGGVLNGVLLREGLVDELKLIINPCLTGGTSPRTLFVAPDLTSRDGVIPLKLVAVEEMGNGYLLLEYQVVKPEARS